MPIESTPYDLANLQQITQGGGAFMDYLRNQRAQQDQATNAQQRLESALALQRAENEGGVQRVEAAGRLASVEKALDRKNALEVVSAQEHARVAAQRAAALSGLQARYPRQGDEDDDAYMERVGKLQAVGPNKIYRSMLAKQAATDTKSQELERSIESALADEENKRRPKIAAMARKDPDLDAAFREAGGKGNIPVDVPSEIQKLRAQKGGAAKADALEAAWSAALMKYDDPKLVPYSVELGTKIQRTKDQIHSLQKNFEEERAQLSRTRIELLNDRNFIGGPHLEFGDEGAPATPRGASAPASAPLGPPANLAPPPAARLGDAAAAFLGGSSPTETATTQPPPPPAMEGAIPDALRAGGDILNRGVVQPLVGLNNDIASGSYNLAPSRSDMAPLLSELRGAGSDLGNTANAIRRTLIRRPGESAPSLPDPLTAYLAPIQRGGQIAGAIGEAIGTPVSETLQGLASYVQPAAWNNDPTALKFPRSYQAHRAIALFGPDALQLLSQAKQVGLQRGVRPEDTQATFDRAINGDKTAIGHVRNFFQMLRMGPIQDDPHGPPIDSTIRDEPMGPPIDSTIRDDAMGPPIGFPSTVPR